MPYLLGALALVVIGGWKLFKTGVNSMNAWGDYLVKGERPWDDNEEDKK